MCGVLCPGIWLMCLDAYAHASLAARCAQVNKLLMYHCVISDYIFEFLFVFWRGKVSMQK